jgi:hypothetical protein
MPDFDAHVPNLARVYNYWLGGKDNFEADRIVAEQAMAAFPNIRFGVHANRRFLGRAVRYMSEQGVRQFLDVGTGLPVEDNTHQVAQRIDPAARVVYVDNDPIVLSHAHALLTGTPGTVSYIEADARDTKRILDGAAQSLDFTQPVGVLLIAILHCIPDEEDPEGVVAAYMAALPPGSFLAISHPATDQLEDGGRLQASMTKSLGQPITFRPQDQVAAFFAGLELTAEGVVPAQLWRPESDLDRNGPASGMWAGVGRKPHPRQ